MKLKEGTNLKGHWRIEVRQKGKLIRVIDKDNTLTEGYQNAILEHLTGNAGTDLEIKYLAVGTDSTQSDKTDIALGAEVFRSVPTSTALGNGYARTIWVLTNEQANYNLREIGVFIGNATTTPDSGTLMSRINININKNDSMEVMFIRDDYVNI